MQESLISIIVPAYNCQKYIGKCLDSLISQSYENLEIIVINDGSEDDTDSILKRYDNKIKIIEKENSGPSKTRNLGIENSHGEFICFVDADDYLECDALSIAVSNFAEDIDVVKFKYKVDINGKLSDCVCKQVSGIFDSAIVVNKLMLNTTFWNTCWGQLIRKSAIDNVWFESNIRIGEDLLFNYKLYKNSRRIKVIDDELYYYVSNVDGITKKIDFESITNNIKDVFKSYDYLINEFVERDNQKKIVNRAVESIISYQRQLLYVSFFRGIKFLNDFNRSKGFLFFLNRYKGSKYSVEISLLKLNCYLFYSYVFIVYMPLKRIKEMTVFLRRND
ncbi:glycosyltransferase family 2 protein [Amedibacillus dolichus]|uniref:glycosyltransferase family 2 protein n=1 Tax=Amedibacillus dolichus TaxID=31971 RepID=UPI001EDC9215|nr:glycosyltransferase family 2 protein [Amedibacillus dolichus]MCG4879039.1 glycosyltransferase family 2 protein [Amedibacillus dolichus]